MSEPEMLELAMPDLSISYYRFYIKPEWDEISTYKYYQK